MARKQIGRYEIKAELGRGGMATVHQGKTAGLQAMLTIQFY